MVQSQKVDANILVRIVVLILQLTHGVAHGHDKGERENDDWAHGEGSRLSLRSDVEGRNGSLLYMLVCIIHQFLK